MLVSITGTGGGSGNRVSGPTSKEIADALQECGSSMGRSPTGSATQMLLVDLARYFSSIRLLSATEVDGHWHSDAIVNVQSRGNASVSLKIQFHLQHQDATWVISAARLLQS
jgi:hypothetical protein